MVSHITQEKKRDCWENEKIECWIKCLLCDTAYGVGSFPAGSRTEREALEMMHEHLLEYHSMREIEGLLKRNMRKLVKKTKGSE